MMCEIIQAYAGTNINMVAIREYCSETSAISPSNQPTGMYNSCATLAATLRTVACMSRGVCRWIIGVSVAANQPLAKPKPAYMPIVAIVNATLRVIPAVV